MKITVDRHVSPEGNLVFTITATQPHEVPFSADDKKIMDCISVCRQEIQDSDMEYGLIKEDLLNSLHGAKDCMFQSVIKNIKQAIKWELQPKIKAICQEIYNWMYDNQTDMLKAWLQDFDPQRTKYYFDNDKTIESDYDDE